jgi:hypothetical protein
METIVALVTALRLRGNEHTPLLRAVISMKKYFLPNLQKSAALSGTFGPLLFGLTLLIFTLLDADFLRGLGWDPLTAPTFDWPSGLSLGPHGGIMITVFIVNGLLMMLFALGLGQSLPRTPVSRAAMFLMVLSGAAMMGLAFLTDPTIRDYPATWHGRVHDLSFVALGLTLFPSMILFGWAWREHRLYTWLTVACAIPAFALKGIAFYIFLAAVLSWSVVTARRMVRIISV